MLFPISNGVSNGALNYIINHDLQSLIDITSSGSYYTDRPASDLAKGSVFYTERNNAYGQWIQFRFTKNVFDFQGYSLMANDYREYPFVWKFEVSPDNVYWALASTKTGQNTTKPGQKYATSLFKGIKYIKMTQTGHGGSAQENRNYIQISRIDFFGKLYGPIRCTCKQINKRSNFVVLSYIIMAFS